MKIHQILSKERLVEILSRVSKVRAGVIGDFALDAYWLVDMRRSRLSRETPHFPRPVVAETYAPGAGGNAAKNLAALGLRSVMAFSVVGEDAWGVILKDQLEEQNISSQGLLRQANRHTPAYIKPILMGYDSRQEDARLDFENLQPLSSEAEEALLKVFEDQLEQMEVVLVSDQLEENGTITGTPASWWIPGSALRSSKIWS
jgi:bifunctional ADP-heptose synthase (sugar kinase/adenylyltransferase)